MSIHALFAEEVELIVCAILREMFLTIGFHKARPTFCRHSILNKPNLAIVIRVDIAMSVFSYVCIAVANNSIYWTVDNLIDCFNVLRCEEKFSWTYR